MMPGITPAKISAIIAQPILLFALSVAMSPLFTAVYIRYTLRNTNIATTKSTKKGIAKIMVKIDATAPAIQPMSAMMLNMKAISMYVFMLLKRVSAIPAGGGGGY